MFLCRPDTSYNDLQSGLIYLIWNIVLKFLNNQLGKYSLGDGIVQTIIVI